MDRLGRAGVSPMIGNVLMLAIVVSVVTIVFAVAVPQFRRLEAQGKAETGASMMTKLESAIADLAVSDRGRSDRVAVDVPAGGLSVPTNRSCLAVSYSARGTQRLNFTIAGAADRDNLIDVRMFGSDGLAADTDDPDDLVADPTQWVQGRRKELDPSPTFQAAAQKKAYVFGGGTTPLPTDRLDQIVSFDPGQGVAELETETLPEPLSLTSAVWDPETHRAYIFGGGTLTGSSDSIVAYTPDKDSTSEIATFSVTRADTSAVWDPERDVAYVFGGQTANADDGDDIVRFDPDGSAGDTVKVLSVSLPSPRNSTSAVWDPSQDVAYIFGGTDEDLNGFDSILRFDPRNGTLTDLTATEGTALPTVLWGTSAVWNPEQDVAYVLGGYDGAYFDEIVKFDPDASSGDKVTVVDAALPSKRAFTSSAWDSNRQVAYVFGGYDGASSLAEIVEFSPEDGAASPLEATLPTARLATSAVYTPTGKQSLSLTDDGSPISACVGRLRLTIRNATTDEPVGEGWLLGSDSLRWQANLYTGTHEVELLQGGRVEDDPARGAHLKSFNGVRAASGGTDTMTVSSTRVVFDPGGAPTAPSGRVVVPMRSLGSFEMTTEAHGNATLRFLGERGALFHDRVGEEPGMRRESGLDRVWHPFARLTVVDRVVVLPEGVVS